MCPVYNGQPVDENVTNPAFLDAQVDDTALGKITLANADVASGLTVTNTQQWINSLIQNSKIIIRTDDNSPVNFNGTQLIFTDDLIVQQLDTGFITRVLQANSPISIPDGSSVYFTISRTANTSVIPTVLPTVSKNVDAFSFCSRIDSVLIFFDNTLLRTGNNTRIGEGSQDLAAFQQTPTGVVDGVNDTFSLTYPPLSQETLVLFQDNLVVPKTEYSLVNATITFNTPPVATQNIYSFYIYQGSIATVSPSGLENVEYRTLTAGEAAAEQLTLANTPVINSKCKLDMIGGTAQEYGVDFIVTSNILDWNGYGLDGILVTGDKLRIVYFS